MTSLRDKADNLYKRGDYRSAIALYDRAISREASVPLLDRRAACYQKVGDLSTALKDAKAAIQLQREDATGYMRAGRILVDMGKKSVALEIYTHGLKCVKHVGWRYETLQKAQKELRDQLFPPKCKDPLTVLPRELAEIVMEHLSFQQRMNACLVSAGWARFIRSIPALWKHMDLSAARKKVPTKFISRAINTARDKLTKATLKNLGDFDKCSLALVKNCPIEEVVLIECGLQSRNLTTFLEHARHLKRLKLDRKTESTSSELPYMLMAVSDRLESFECTLTKGRLPDCSKLFCNNLTSLTICTGAMWDTMPLLGGLARRIPMLQSFTLRQTAMSSASHLGLDFSECQNLRRLDLTCPISSAYMLQLPRLLTHFKFKSVVLSTHTAFFSGSSANFPAFDLPYLEELEIEIMHMTIVQVGQALFCSVVKNEEGEPVCPSKLRRLVVCDAESDPDELPALLLHERLKDLEQLGLPSLAGCDDDSVTMILKAFPRLRTLDLSGTDVTGVGVKQIVKSRHVQQLVLNDCRKLGRDAVEWAREQGISVHYRMTDTATAGKKVRH